MNLRICLNLSVSDPIKSPQPLCLSFFFSDKVVNFMVDMANLFAQKN